MVARELVIGPIFTSGFLVVLDQSARLARPSSSPHSPVNKRCGPKKRFSTLSSLPQIRGDGGGCGEAEGAPQSRKAKVMQAFGDPTSVTLIFELR